MPSPSSDTVIPAHSSRKLRWRSGTRRFSLEKPPGRSSDSWLCSRRFGLLSPGGRWRLGLLACEELAERVLAHRLGEEEALTELAAQIAQGRHLVETLDALGDDVEPEALAEGDDRRGEAGVRLVVGDEERAVHLED